MFSLRLRLVLDRRSNKLHSLQSGNILRRSRGINVAVLQRLRSASAAGERLDLQARYARARSAGALRGADGNITAPVAGAWRGWPPCAKAPPVGVAVMLCGGAGGGRMLFTTR